MNKVIFIIIVKNYYYYYYYYFKQSSFRLAFLYFRTNKTLSRTIALLATTFPFLLPP